MAATLRRGMSLFRLLPLGLPALACVAALSLPTAASAAGQTKVGVDKKTQVSFSLTGRSLTVTLRPLGGAINPLVNELWGAPVTLACRGFSPKGGKAHIATTTTTWLDEALTTTVKLSRDVSGKTTWCVMEQPDGTDLAVTTKLRTPAPA